MSLNALGVDAEHTAHEFALALNNREPEFLLVCKVGFFLRPVRIERVIVLFSFAFINVLITIIGTKS